MRAEFGNTSRVKTGRSRTRYEAPPAFSLSDGGFKHDCVGGRTIGGVPKTEKDKYAFSKYQDKRNRPKGHYGNLEK